MKEYLSLHPWILWLSLFALGFILNTARRLIVESRKMPREEKLELNLRRASRALRKLGRAKRIIHRYITVRDAAPRTPMPDMVRRLWKASSDAADAKNHLSEVLKNLLALFNKYTPA